MVAETRRAFGRADGSDVHTRSTPAVGTKRGSSTYGGSEVDTDFVVIERTPRGDRPLVIYSDAATADEVARTLRRHGKTAWIVELPRPVTVAPLQPPA